MKDQHNSSARGLLKKKLSLAFCCIVFLFSCEFAFSQKLEPKERVVDPDHVISSKITGNDYDLYISFPGDYSVKDTLHYPVLYVLDGMHYYPLLNQARTVMDWAGGLQDVIIVCISSGKDFLQWFTNRTLDYTPSASPAGERNMEKGYGLSDGALQSGGASRFLSSIKEEIVPFIDKHYKTTSDRGIAGHSFGGLFAAYCLVHSPDYFSRYGINSPSFWWDDQKLLTESKAVLDAYPAIKAKVFLSAGAVESSGIVPPSVRFVYDLKSRRNKGIETEWTLFEKENHFSVVPAALSRTLSVLYGK